MIKKKVASEETKVYRIAKRAVEKYDLPFSADDRTRTLEYAGDNGKLINSVLTLDSKISPIVYQQGIENYDYSKLIPEYGIRNEVNEFNSYFYTLKKYDDVKSFAKDSNLPFRFDNKTKSLRYTGDQDVYDAVFDLQESFLRAHPEEESMPEIQWELIVPELSKYKLKSDETNVNKTKGRKAAALLGAGMFGLGLLAAGHVLTDNASADDISEKVNLEPIKQVNLSARDVNETWVGGEEAYVFTQIPNNLTVDASSQLKLCGDYALKWKVNDLILHKISTGEEKLIDNSTGIFENSIDLSNYECAYIKTSGNPFASQKILRVIDTTFPNLKYCDSIVTNASNINIRDHTTQDGLQDILYSYKEDNTYKLKNYANSFEKVFNNATETVEYDQPLTALSDKYFVFKTSTGLKVYDITNDKLSNVSDSPNMPDQYYPILFNDKLFFVSKHLNETGWDIYSKNLTSSEIKKEVETYSTISGITNGGQIDALSIDKNFIAYTVVGNGWTCLFDRAKNETQQLVPFNPSSHGWDVALDSERLFFHNSGNIFFAKYSINHSPLIKQIQNQTSIRGYPWQQKLEAYDPDGDNFTIGLVSTDIALTGTADNATIRLIDSSNIGEYPCKIRVEDYRGAITEMDFKVNVVENQKPIITGLEDTSTYDIKYGALFERIFNVTDPEGKSLEVLLDSGSNNFILEKLNDGNFSVKLLGNFRTIPGKYVADVGIRDGSTMFLKHLEVNVLDNNKPVISALNPEYEVGFDDGFEKEINITDPDGHSLNVALNGATYYFTLTKNPNGNYTLKLKDNFKASPDKYLAQISATDEYGKFTEVLTNVTVKPNNPPTLENVTGQFSDNNTKFISELLGADINNDTLTYLLYKKGFGNESRGIFFEAESDSASWNASTSGILNPNFRIFSENNKTFLEISKLDECSYFKFGLNLKDEHGAEIQKEFMFKIPKYNSSNQTTNNPPTLEDIIGNFTDKNTWLAKLNASDPDGDSLNYSIKEAAFTVEDITQKCKIGINATTVKDITGPKFEIIQNGTDYYLKVTNLTSALASTRSSSYGAIGPVDAFYCRVGVTDPFGANATKEVNIIIPKIDDSIDVDINNDTSVPPVNGGSTGDTSNPPATDDTSANDIPSETDDVEDKGIIDKLSDFYSWAKGGISKYKVVISGALAAGAGWWVYDNVYISKLTNSELKKKLRGKKNE